MKWLLLLIPLTLAACATTKNYGAGPCTEYSPLCVSGDRVCEHDKRGCEICTCVNDSSAIHGPDLPPGQEVPTSEPGWP